MNDQRLKQGDLVFTDSDAIGFAAPGEVLADFLLPRGTPCVVAVDAAAGPVHPYNAVFWQVLSPKGTTWVNEKRLDRIRR